MLNRTRTPMLFLSVLSCATTAIAGQSLLRPQATPVQMPPSAIITYITAEQEKIAHQVTFNGNTLISVPPHASHTFEQLGVHMNLPSAREEAR